jgi:hypothetical protein
LPSDVSVAEEWRFSGVRTSLTAPFLHNGHLRAVEKQVGDYRKAMATLGKAPDNGRPLVLQLPEIKIADAM